MMVSEKSKISQLLAGNWKMNGLRSALAEIRALGRGVADLAGVEVIICPPATLLAEAAKAAEGASIGVGGQDCHVQKVGAYTGEISAEMLRDAGASYVILGHSERRQYQGESDGLVAEKVAAALQEGLKPILCVGESEEVRDAGNAEQVVTEQLLASLPKEYPSNSAPEELAVAYEPIWAIGTGRTPTNDQIAQMHSALRDALSVRYGAEISVNIRILYGGSVKPNNAGEILAVTNVDGALVGGASLKAADFLAIVHASAQHA
jgi:triosephosphate isomerase